MEEEIKEYWTIDEKIDFHQKLLDARIKDLEGNYTSERKMLEKEKEAEEQTIDRLEELKRRLLEKPKFLFLIVSNVNCKVKNIYPTYIVTADEAKRYAESIIRKLLDDNHVHLELGAYVGIIVDKTLYYKLQGKETVRSIFTSKDKVYVNSKEFVVTDMGVKFP